MQSPSRGDRGEELEVTSGRSSPGAEPSSLWPKGQGRGGWGCLGVRRKSGCLGQN